MVSRSGKNECFGYVGFMGGAGEPQPLRVATPVQDARHQARVILIEPRPPARTSLAHALSGRSSASRRAEDFTVWSVVDARELNTLPGWDGAAAAILLNLGAGCVAEPKTREDVRQLVAAFPAIPLVLVADCANPRHVLGALRHGARGYIPSVLVSHMAVQALRLILAGGVFVPPNLLVDGGTALEEPPPGQCEVPQDFTPRQSEVFELLRKGKSNKVIAYELGMRESTVKVHVRQIMRKLKATNRTHAAFLAARMAGGGVA